MHRLPLSRRLSTGLAALLICAAAAGTAQAQAQFAEAPPPKALTAAPSAAATDVLYRKDAARHLYAAYPGKIHKGKLPPMLVGVAIINTTIDATGQVTAVDVMRPPAMKEIAPWVETMIRAAAPYPAPTKLGQSVTWREIFLVEAGGKFQVDALTEGQRNK
ncbi:MAG: hypothetical protein RLZZ584_32 [Pseudomonadota bacterium]|jgi:hypothetical protein